MIHEDKPRYKQIVEHLSEAINQKIYIAGDQLPSEKRMCDYYKVSRITIRNALKILEGEGYIYKKQGLGAFVRDSNPEPNLVRLTDFSEDMRKAGLTSSSKLISFKKVVADSTVNPILEIAPDKPLIKIERIRYANRIAIAFDTTWLPLHYGRLLMNHDLKKRTIYEIFEDEFQIPIRAGRYSISASTADSRIAKLLAVDHETALLEIKRCSKTNGGKKIYYQIRYNNPAFISYEMELFRRDTEKGDSRDGLPLKEFHPKFNI